MEKLPKTCPVCSGNIIIYEGSFWKTFYCSNKKPEPKKSRNYPYESSHYCRFIIDNPNNRSNKRPRPYDSILVGTHLAIIFYDKKQKFLTIGITDPSDNLNTDWVFEEMLISNKIKIIDLANIKKLEELVQNYRIIS